MNPWARTQLGLGALGVVAFAAVGGQGLLAEPSEEMVALHTQLALVATLLVVLSYAWVAIFLVACERGLRRLGSGWPDASLVRARRRSVGWILAALALLLGHFVAAGSLFAARVPGWLHGTTAGLTLVVLILAWGFAAADLARHGARVAAQVAASGVLDSPRS